MHSTTTRRHALRLMAGLMVGAPSALPVRAHDGAHPKTAPSGEEFQKIEQKSRQWFTDSVLVDQHGKSLRFYSDVLRGRTVLINVIFTQCKDACPMITRSLVEVRRALEPPASTAIHFVSISVDPENDTPAVLRKYAQAQEAEHPAWHFLTGRKQAIDEVTRKLGQYAAEPQMHTSLLIAGNVDKAHWIKIRPDTKPAHIAIRLQDLAKG